MADAPLVIAGRVVLARDLARGRFEARGFEVADDPAADHLFQAPYVHATAPSPAPTIARSSSAG